MDSTGGRCAGRRAGRGHETEAARFSAADF